MDKIRLVEDYGAQLHVLHGKLREDILKDLNEEQRTKVIRVLNLSSEDLRNYTNSLYPKMRDALK